MADRPGRPTARVDRTRGRSTLGVDRRAQACARLAATGTVDRQGRPDLRAELSVCLGRPGGRPGCPNGHISDRWRSAGSLSGCHISLTASFLMGLYKPQFFGILAKIFTREKLLFPQSFKQVFKSVFRL